MARGKKKETLTPEERLQAALVPEREQPYKVPGNWCWIQLGELYQINPKNLAEDFVDAAFIPMEKIAPGFVNEYSFDVQPWCKAKKGHTQFADGDVAFAKISPCFENRKSMLLNNLPNGIGGGTTELVVLRQSHMNQKYTFWFISQEQFIRGGIATYSGTVGQQRISMDYVRTYPIPVPPLPEQQRIVERIESLFVKLDEAKQKAQDALDSFETRKAAILHKAFTGELTAQWRKEHGVGMVSWRTVTFKDACLKITDGTHHSPVNTPTGEYMYVTAKNIKETGIDLTNITFVSKDVHDEIYSRCDVQYGDVLYIKDGATTGIAAVNTIEEPFSLLSSVAVLRPDKKQIVAEYMVYNLNSSKTKTMMINNMSGNAITRLTLSKIKTAPITVCSLDEQNEIVRILDDLLAKEQQAKEAAERVLEQIDLIKKAILARAFRGELGTNDPSEESAMELLKSVV